MQHLDQQVWQWFISHRTGTWNSIHIFFSDAFQPRWVVVMAVVLTAILAVRARGSIHPMRWWIVGYPAVTLILAVSTSSTLKHLIGRQRPDQAYRLVVETNPSMPSGHAIAACALATVLTLLTRHWLATVLVWAVAAVVCVGRLYLGVHWLSDVIVGITIGVTVALVVWWLMNRLHKRTVGASPAS